jgi:hypothetical protein
MKPKESKEIIEKQDADKIIEKTSSEYLDEKYVEDMKKGYDNLTNMIRRYDPNKKEVRNMSEEDKDKIYGIAEYLFNEYQLKLNHMSFSFELTTDEWEFMIDLFKNKIEYDQNEIFQLKELKENYLDEGEKKYKELNVKKSKTNFETYINVNDLIILYHLISKYKVKGTTKYYYNYLSLLTKIGERIKLFNAYNVWIQRLSDDFQIWGAGLTVDDEMLNGKKEEETKDKTDKKEVKTDKNDKKEEVEVV